MRYVAGSSPRGQCTACSGLGFIDAAPVIDAAGRWAPPSAPYARCPVCAGTGIWPHLMTPGPARPQ